jgi:hypothetical protein
MPPFVCHRADFSVPKDVLDYEQFGTKTLHECFYGVFLSFLILFSLVPFKTKHRSSQSGMAKDIV